MLKVITLFLLISSIYPVTTFAKTELGNYDDYRNFQLDLQNCKSEAKNSSQSSPSTNDASSGGSIGAQLLSAAITGLFNGISAGMEIGQKVNNCMGNLGWTEVDENEKSIKKSNVDSYILFLKEFPSIQRGICQNQEFQAVFKKSSCEIAKIDQMQLNDKSLISENEKVELRQLSEFSKSYTLRRIELLRAIRWKSTDEEAALVSELNLANEENRQLLIDRKQSWGSFNRSRVENYSNFKQKLDNINNQRNKSKAN